MSTRKRSSPSLSSNHSSSYRSSLSRRSTRRRTIRNAIIQIAKDTKDKHVINRLAVLAKHYKLYHKKKDLTRLESLLISSFPNTRISQANGITSEDKDGFIDFLAQLKTSESSSATREQTLNRFLKSAPV